MAAEARARAGGLHLNSCPGHGPGVPWPGRAGKGWIRSAAARLAVVMALAGVLAAASPTLIPPQRAAASTVPVRVQALLWAEHQAGKWYCYGGSGPGCFDCSGLVMEAFAHAGITLPRTTYDMITSSRLVRIPVSQAKRGDLMFYGPGHAELKTLHGTFGALESGTRIGWHRPSAYWHPTMAFRLR